MDKNNSDSWHPVKILRDEHKVITEFLNRLNRIVNEILSVSSPDEIKPVIPRLKHITGHFTDFEKHYSKEEHVIFPYVEKAKFFQPTRELWNGHSRIKDLSDKLNMLIDNFNDIDINKFKSDLEKYSSELTEIIQNHFKKEDEVLFPAVDKHVKKNDWDIIRADFNLTGYCCLPLKADELKSEINIDEIVSLKNSGLDLEAVDAALKILPLDITILDKNDRIVYYNKTEDQIFLRTASIIGRDVILCHPPKVEKTVKKVMELLKNGRKDEICMWSDDKTKHIRYIAVRGTNGEYLGCIETVLDVSEYKVK